MFECIRNSRGMRRREGALLECKLVESLVRFLLLLLTLMGRTEWESRSRLGLIERKLSLFSAARPRFGPSLHSYQRSLDLKLVWVKWRGQESHPFRGFASRPQMLFISESALSQSPEFSPSNTILRGFGVQAQRISPPLKCPSHLLQIDRVFKIETANVKWSVEKECGHEGMGKQFSGVRIKVFSRVKSP